LPTTKRRRSIFFEERFEGRPGAGGLGEVKSLREGKVQLTDGYVVHPRWRIVRHRPARSTRLHTASSHVSPDKVRTKKLLMHKDKIERLIGKVEQKGYTLVPAQPALERRQGQMRHRFGQRQGRARQARHRSRTVRASAEVERATEEDRKLAEQRADCLAGGSGLETAGGLVDPAGPANRPPAISKPLRSPVFTSAD